MKIGVKQAAELLSVSDKTIYRWVAGGQIPFYRVGSQYRFSRNELLRWVAADHSVSPASVGTSIERIAVSLGSSLRGGGIFYQVGGGDVLNVLEQMLLLMRLPVSADLPFILNRLHQRELIATTGIGDGIALPHCRDLALPGVSEPLIALGFLEHPVDFFAIDNQSVSILFLLLSPSARASIRAMSRLAYALKKPDVIQVLRNHSSQDLILEAVDQVDRELNRH